MAAPGTSSRSRDSKRSPMQTKLGSPIGQKRPQTENQGQGSRQKKGWNIPIFKVQLSLHASVGTMRLRYYSSDEDGDSLDTLGQVITGIRPRPGDSSDNVDLPAHEKSRNPGTRFLHRNSNTSSQFVSFIPNHLPTLAEPYTSSNAHRALEIPWITRDIGSTCGDTPFFSVSVSDMS